MRAKVLLQEIWTAGIDWDDVLPPELRRKWEQWLSELPQLSNISIPRCLRRANPEKTNCISSQTHRTLPMQPSPIWFVNTQTLPLPLV